MKGTAVVIIFAFTVIVAIVFCIFKLLSDFLLKESNDVRISKNIIYSFSDKYEDNLDELIEFSKINKSEYRI